MIKSLMDKLTVMLRDYKKLNNKKIIEYLVLVAVLGVVIIITANTLWGGNNKQGEQQLAKPKMVSGKQMSEPNSGLQQKLAQVLSQIRGVGRVSVLVTYTSGPESVYATDVKQNETDTNEKDSEGGERKVIQKDHEDNLVMVEEQGGVKKPVVLKQLTSRVMGVVVVADGADNQMVRDDIVKAVEVLAGVPSHRVQVFKKQ